MPWSAREPQTPYFTLDQHLFKLGRLGPGAHYTKPPAALRGPKERVPLESRTSLRWGLQPDQRNASLWNLACRSAGVLRRRTAFHASLCAPWPHGHPTGQTLARTGASTVARFIGCAVLIRSARASARPEVSRPPRQSSNYPCTRRIAAEAGSPLDFFISRSPFGFTAFFFRRAPVPPPRPY